MENRQQNQSGGGMTLDDIYFVLFRHKWKIIILSLAGFLAAGVIYKHKPPDYQSEAKLMIKYVVDNTTPGPVQNEAHMQSTDPQGQSIINTEVEILTSLDVARKVAEDLGPDKILPGKSGGHDVMQAAGFIAGHLRVISSVRSSVIEADFKHPDPEMVQPILSQIISEYKKKHIEVHQPNGPNTDFFTTMTDNYKNELAEIEKGLKNTRTNAGVISTEDALKEYSKSIEKTHQDITDAEAQMALLTASFNAMTHLSLAKPAVTNANINLETNSEPPIPTTVVEQYSRVARHLNALWTHDEELVTQGYRDGSTPVLNNRAEIKKMETQKQKLEEDYPGLKLANPQIFYSKTPQQAAQSQSADPSLNLSNQAIQISALQSKIDFLKSRLVELQIKADKIADLQPRVSELELRRRMAEENLQSYTKNLEGARISEALGAGKAPNIMVIQEPSPPGRDWSKRYKAMQMLILAGLGSGFAWAFLIEFYLDTSVKRAKDVRIKLGMPLFLSIPDTRRGARLHRALANSSPAPRAIASTEATSKLEVALWDHNHSLRPYYEALRDRLLGYFEAKNLTHNPKLVAVTGSSKGSGATTLAMGLAASLSETGDGNVLLVDMNQEHGASQHFYKGKPNCGLDDVLENETRETALVQDNLYVVNANSNGDRLPRILPKRFASLVPKFKASDFDYIIFDMPPISQTSITLRLAGFMDTVLLVVESEKTNRDAVLQAGALLAEAKANVNVVLNKTRSYVPSQLRQEF